MHTHTRTHSHTHTRACVCTHVSLFVDPITRTPLGASFPPANRKRTLDIKILIYVTFTHGRLPGQNQFAARAAACAGQPGGVACPWRASPRAAGCAHSASLVAPNSSPFSPRAAPEYCEYRQDAARGHVRRTQAGPGRPGGTRARPAHAPAELAEGRRRNAASAAVFAVPPRASRARPPLRNGRPATFATLRGPAGGPPPGARARGGTRHGIQFQTQFIPEKYDTRIAFPPGFSTLNHRGIIRCEPHFIACMRCTTIAQRAFRNRVFKRGIWSV